MSSTLVLNATQTNTKHIKGVKIALALAQMLHQTGHLQLNYYMELEKRKTDIHKGR